VPAGLHLGCWYRVPLHELPGVSAAAGAIGCARLHAVAILHEWGLRGLAEDAALIVSELMTNAAGAAMLLPDRPPVTLRLLASERSLVIEAWDHSPLDLETREAGPDAECGRGLTRPGPDRPRLRIHP
jgi:anti-sigma regulatory factor (Ser/Thr protein kinase)